MTTLLVGREAAIALLDGALADASAEGSDGRGRLVLISGPAGIGKSALADRAAVLAAGRGMRVLRGHAVDDPGAPALWPWRRALRGIPAALRLLDTGDDGDGGVEDRFRMAAGVSECLMEQAADGGLLLVLEDLHWADGGTVHLLTHLTAELAVGRVVVVATRRDRADGPLAGALPDLLRGDRTSVVAPAPLTEGQVAAYLAGRGADPASAASLHARAGGNPLLVRLLADHLATGGHVDTAVRDRPDLRRLVTARLSGMDRAARDTVDAAAILGERVDPVVLAATAGLAADRLDATVAECIAAGVFERTGDVLDGVGFVHALVRDAVLTDLPERVGATGLARLHARAAEALSASGAAAATVVGHWQRAGPQATPGVVRRWAERATDEALGALAHDEAVRFAALAVTAAEDDRADDAELARLLVRLAAAAVRAARFEEAVSACVRAADRADRAARPDLLADAALAVHGVGVTVFDDLAPVVERALAACPPSEHGVRARLLAQLSVGRAETDAVEDARVLAGRALDEADRARDPVATLEALAARHLAIVDPGTVRERLELGRRAVALGEGDGSPIAALWGHLWRASASFQLGNLVNAELEIAELDRIARTRRSPLARWHFHRFRALADALAGDFAAARDHNRAAFAIGERVDDPTLTGMCYSFGLFLGDLRGDPADLLPGWEQAMRFAPPLPIVRAGIALARCLAGRPDDARAEFARFRDLPATMPRGVRWAGTMSILGRTALRLGDARTCAAVFPVFAALASEYAGDGSGAVVSHGANAGFAADLARVAGRDEDALPLYRTAVAMNERIGARPWTALARLGWATSLRRLGRTRDGAATVDDLVRDATVEFRRLDMPGPLATALAQAGSGAHGPQLTPRESEVAALVADALTNRAIAARLVLSERTVETHVRNVLAKTGATKRTEIVAWWLRRQG
ncbi:ATP-binding protein [Jatrophihabitans fulvus]